MSHLKKRIPFDPPVPTWIKSFPQTLTKYYEFARPELNADDSIKLNVNTELSGLVGLQLIRKRREHKEFADPITELTMEDFNKNH
jgi:hypothetical protein